MYLKGKYRASTSFKYIKQQTMVGSIYVSDPEFWIKFYDELDAGRETYIPRRSQGGAGIGGMYRNRRAFIRANSPVKKAMVGENVTPVGAYAERSKLQLKAAIRENRQHVPVSDKSGQSMHASVSDNTDQSTYKYKSRGETNRKRKRRPFGNYDNFLVTKTDGAPPGVRASKKKCSKSEH